MSAASAASCDSEVLPRVSVVIEMGTREVTGRVALTESIARQINEAYRFREGEVEFIFVGAYALPRDQLGLSCKALACPDTGYYGWKNAGARAACGEYLVFWDSDCRPDPGYLQRVVETLDEDLELAGVAGCTVYDGTSFCSRLNTVLSFGYLFQQSDCPKPYAALSHNVAIRRSMFPNAPFGSFAARAGGDMYLTYYADSIGRPLKLDRQLLIRHEDPSFSLHALLERHLRELFLPWLRSETHTRGSALRLAWRSLLQLPAKRYRKVRTYGKYCDFTPGEVLLSLPILLAYWLIDASALAALTVFPRLLTKWLWYQFGLTPRGGK